MFRLDGWLMKTYLVGGAVRDRLLNYPVSEKDWVVVGATAEHLLDKGYQQVGKDFPVFLHPQSKEEYALARTERKTGRGYTGFHCYASPDVTLEEDLKRRDLTINAIAEDEHGNLIDPYGGQKDLADKMLRHVSAAFEEDPLRVLRVARFYARYCHLGFNIADETLELMRAMVARGELKDLVAERVWMEIHRVLGEQHPEVFYRLMDQIGGMEYLVPEFADSALLEKAMKALQRLLDKTDELQCRFAGVYMHLSESALRGWCETFRVPVEYRDLALMANRHFGAVTTNRSPAAERLLGLLVSLDAFRRPDRFKRCLLVCEAAAQAEQVGNSFQVGELLGKVYPVAALITARDVAPDLHGKAIGDSIADHRIRAIGQLLEGD